MSSIANAGFNRVGVNIRANTVNTTESNSNEISVGNISGSLYNGAPFIGPTWFAENVDTSLTQLVLPNPEEYATNKLSAYIPGLPMSVMGGTLTVDGDAGTANDFGVYMYLNNSGTASASGYYISSSFTSYNSDESLVSRQLFSPSGLIIGITDLVTFKAKSTDGSDPKPDVSFVPFGKLYEF